MIELQRCGAMGKFSVEFDISNRDDIREVTKGRLAPEKVTLGADPHPGPG
jgi:hypothetical protein